MDDAQIFSLIKYASVKEKQKIVKSDHNVMFASFDIQFQNMNFKNKDSIFTEVNNLKLRKCFKSENTFPVQCKMFLKSLDGLLHQCFRKVRMKENKGKNRNSKVVR